MKVGTNGGAAKTPPPRSRVTRQQATRAAHAAIVKRLASSSDDSAGPGTRGFKPLRTGESDTLRESLRQYGPNDAPANHVHLTPIPKMEGGGRSPLTQRRGGSFEIGTVNPIPLNSTNYDAWQTGFGFYTPIELRRIFSLT